MAHSVSLREAFDDFISDKQYQGVSPVTISFYSRNWHHFVRDTGVKDVADLSAGVIRTWLLGHQGVTPTTLATYDRSLRVTLNWFEKHGYVAESPMKVLPKRRTPRTTVDTFTLAEAQAIIRKAKEGRHPRRDVALVTLLLDTGLRIGEAIGLGLGDVDWVESVDVVPSISSKVFGTTTTQRTSLGGPPSPSPSPPPPPSEGVEVPQAASARTSANEAMMRNTTCGRIGVVGLREDTARKRHRGPRSLAWRREPGVPPGA